MIRRILRVLGIPLVTVDTIHYDFESEDDASEVTGGETHNFERDSDPLSPDDRYRDFEFGFRRPQ